MGLEKFTTVLSGKPHFNMVWTSLKTVYKTKISGPRNTYGRHRGVRVKLSKAIKNRRKS